MNHKLSYNQWLTLCKLANFCFNSNDVSVSFYIKFRVVLLKLIGIQPGTEPEQEFFRTYNQTDGRRWLNKTVYDRWTDDIVYTDKNAGVFNKARELYLNRTNE